MGRRRSKATAGKPRVSQPPTERLDCLPAPNHRARLSLWPEDYRGLTLRPEWLHALLMLMSADKGGGSPTGVLFVDAAYGLRHWAERENCPPTWMDPEVFIRQVLQDAACGSIVADYRAKKSSGDRRKLQAELQRVFQEKYLPYLAAQFSQAVPILAHWVAAYLTTKVQDDQTRAKSSQKRSVKLVLARPAAPAGRGRARRQAVPKK